MRGQMMDARRSCDAAMKEATDQKAMVDRLTSKLTSAKGEAEQAVGETASKVAELDGANREIVDLKEKVEAIERDPLLNVEYVSEFTYYMAYANAISVAKNGGLEVGSLVEAFRSYVLEHPLQPDFTIPILDLFLEHGVDLRWYSSLDNLAHLDAPEDAPQGETVVEEGG
ncbi:hypothetical protein OROHE_004596 [Orobanche hederae]